MSVELLAMLGGGVSGFLMKFIAAQADAQSRHLEAMIRKQEAADQSADKAANRGGVWIRRVFVACILFAVIIAPFILAYSGHGVTVEREGLGGIFKLLGIGRDSWETVQGFVILPEVRQGMLAILGFYFGSSQVK
jgi:ABC-type phosphate transport system permease subunit